MQANELLDIVQRVMPSTSTKGLVEGMDSLLFMNGSVCAYNDKISINYLLPEDIEVEGAVVAKDFYKVIKSIGEKDVKITCDKSMKIIAKGTTAELGLITSDVIKDKIESLGLNSLDFYELPKDFISGLSLCWRSASDNVGSDQNLFCISCFDENIISTDRYRISSYVMKDKLQFPFLLPKTMAQHVVSFKPDQYCTKDGWVHFLNENDAVLSCRIVQDDPKKFKEFLKFYEHCRNPSVMTLPESLKIILDDVVSFSDELLAVQKNVFISIEKGILSCKIQKDSGWVKKRIKIKDKIEVEFFISGVFLREILNYSTTLKIGDTKQNAVLSYDNYKHMIVLPLDK